jgi:hypothetical protein
MPRSSEPAALLRAVRRSGDEAQFTQVIAGVAAAEPTFAAALAAVLVDAVRHQQRTQVDSLGCVPPRLLCRPEETVRTAAGQDRGRIDLLFHTLTFDFRLLVELKLGSGYGEDQIQRYLEALDDMNGRRGLVAVTTNVPGVGEPEDDRPFWLGSIRWRKVLGTLRELPLPEPLGGQWRTWLSIMEGDGDFGMSIDETAVRGWSVHARTREALCQLMEGLAPHAAVHLRAELAKRQAWARMAPIAIVDHVFRGAQKKTSYPTLKTVEGRLRLPADAPIDHPRVIIQFLGGGANPCFTVEARRPGFAQLEGSGLLPGAAKFQAAVNRLAELDPPFSHDPKDRRGYYARVHGHDKWLRPNGPDADALLALIKTDLSALVESGILDPDSGFEADLGVTFTPDSTAEE